MSRVFPFGPSRAGTDRVIPSGPVRAAGLGRRLVEALRQLAARARRFLAAVLSGRALQAAQSRVFLASAACRAYQLPGADLRAAQAAPGHITRLPARDRRP